MYPNKDRTTKPPKGSFIPNKIDQDLINGLNLNDLSDPINKVIEKLTKDINDKKTQVIKDILEKNGIEFDESVEIHRRFKRLLREIRGDEEIYYYNDGSISGLRVVTFRTQIQPFDPDKLSVGYDVNFY